MRLKKRVEKLEEQVDRLSSEWLLFIATEHDNELILGDLLQWHTATRGALTKLLEKYSKHEDSTIHKSFYKGLIKSLEGV